VDKIAERPSQRYIFSLHYRHSFQHSLFLVFRFIVGLMLQWGCSVMSDLTCRKTANLSSVTTNQLSI